MSQDIKQKTKVGMAWNAFEKIAVQGISFVLNIILARLLTPHDYGTIGMILIFLTFSNVFVESGFTRALIQRQDRTEKDFSTVLIFNVLISILLYVILFFASPAIADFYETPELVSLQRVFFLIIILNSLTVVQSAKLQIAVDFKSIAIINSVATIISGVIAVWAAYNDFGVWSLVIQALIKTFVSVIGFWIAGKWIPKTGFDKYSFKRLFGFGSKLLASGLLGTTITNLNNLIIGKIYTPASLGFYTRAEQFPELTSGTLNSVLNNVTFPLMATLQNKQDELIQTFCRLIKLSAMVVFPAMVGLSVLSDEIILVLLGDKWLPTSELLLWLALCYMFKPLSSLNLNLLNAIGRSDLFLKIDFLKVPVIAITMIITFPISLKAVVIGKALAAFIYFYMNGFMIGKLYSFGAFKQLACCWKIIIATIIMAISVWLVTVFVKTHLIGLIAGVLLGATVYVAVLVSLKEEEANVWLKKLKWIKG